MLPITIGLAAVGRSGNALVAEIATAKARAEGTSAIIRMANGREPLVCAIFDTATRADTFIRQARGDVDDSTDCLTAPWHGIGTAQDFDAFDISGKEVGEIKTATRG